MDDSQVDYPSREAMLAEIERLRREVDRLECDNRQLDRLAHLDPLIDLPNRRGFMRQLDMIIARVSRYDEQAAMLFVDIDGLKTINDGFGHPIGDQALIQVARLLSRGVRKGDCVARLGGDEFGILLAHSDEGGAHDTARRLVDAIARARIRCEDDELALSVAIGVTMIEVDDDADSVIERADRAMYRVKAAA